MGFVLKITRASCLERPCHPDLIYLWTDMSNPCDPNEKLSVTFIVPKGTGVQWIKDNLKIESERITSREN